MIMCYYSTPLKQPQQCKLHYQQARKQTSYEISEHLSSNIISKMEEDLNCINNITIF